MRDVTIVRERRVGGYNRQMARDELAGLIERAALAAQARGLLPDVKLPEFTVEPPTRAEHGDYATNLAMRLARAARMAPTAIAATLIQSLPANDVIAAWAKSLPRMFIAGGVAMLSGVVVAGLLARRVTKPILQMTRASRAMAKGDFTQRIDVHGHDEIAVLGSAFNEMAAQVDRSRRAMRQLVADVSHDLKTPLTSIQGFSQALVDGLPGDPQEAGAVINDEADRIRLLVDDLLYLSEIESGALRLDLDPVDIDALVEGSVRRFRFQAEEAQVALVTDLRGDRIRADGRRIEQVLANLIDNAIRFAPADSEVRVSSRRVARGVLVEVHNGGQPIPLDQVERVFDRFYQVDGARSTGRHRGLGLSIVQELVQAHGGTVAVQSTTEAGTTFSVFLPTGGPSTEAPRTGPARLDITPSVAAEEASVPFAPVEDPA